MHSSIERNGPLCDRVILLYNKKNIDSILTKQGNTMTLCVGLFSALQVQTQPLIYVALVSWDWCILCTLWWTQRLYRWLETSTSYHNTLHRYHKVMKEQMGAWLHVFYLLDMWLMVMLILDNTEALKLPPLQACCSVADPDLCLPCRGN